MTGRPKLRARIRDAWRALRGNDASMAMFAHGIRAGQRIAFDTWRECGVVLDPCAPAGDTLSAVAS